MERVSKVENDEWMYSVAEAALEDPGALAIDMCRHGKYSEALEMLETFTETSAMVRRLELKVRRCQEGRISGEGFPYFAMV